MEKEYIVTVKKGVDWREVHAELINDTTADDSVDSNVIPDRACECCKERPLNNRNTHYHLTDAEANQLRNDPRIAGVEDPALKPEPEPIAFQSSNFNKTSTQTGTQGNWGFIRHSATSQIYGSNTSDIGITYDYVLDGTGVDMVIVDTGIQDGHPEWNDANGVSRLQKINWFTESGVPGTQPTNFYTDTNGHGTHCIGTMAGKTFGWARNARIYNITLYSNTGNTISWSDTIDCLIGWHNNKPIDPATGVKRPTVVNMSFQYSWYVNTSTNPPTTQIGTTSYGAITGGNFRGTAHTDTAKTTLNNYGVYGSFRGSGLYLFGYKSAADDADIEQLIQNGIHVNTAAGNNYQKIDLPGGTDYNNYITTDQGYSFYYHRGKSPSTFEGGGTAYVGSGTGNTSIVDVNDGFDVGALDTAVTFPGLLDQKTIFSDTGPAVGIYAAGSYIISAQPNNQGSTYYLDANWRQAKYSGTSMAAPQMCGMMGLLLQAHPDWTPAQVKNYFINNSQSILYDTGLTNDYTDTRSISGGPNRVAYFPMNGQRPFNHASGTLATLSLTADKSSADEGETITYTLNTTGLPDGTVVTGEWASSTDAMENLASPQDIPLFDLGLASFTINNNTATYQISFDADMVPDGPGYPSAITIQTETFDFPLTDRTYSTAPKIIDNVTFGILTGGYDPNNTTYQNWSPSLYSCTIDGNGYIDSLSLDTANNYPNDFEFYHVYNLDYFMVALPASTDTTSKASIASAIASVYDEQTQTFTDSNYGYISAHVESTKTAGPETARLKLTEYSTDGGFTFNQLTSTVSIDVTINDTSTG